MPGSYRRYDRLICAVLRALLQKDAAILDVGPGKGKYSDILHSDFQNIDCMEVYEPYVEKFNLRDCYRRCKVMDARNYAFPSGEYRMVILGDVLEHMSTVDAQKVLHRIAESGSAALVAVPFLYEQGAVKGNEHERHLQPDLTTAVMARRYKNLIPLVEDADTGVYLQRQRLWWK